MKCFFSPLIAAIAVIASSSAFGGVVLDDPLNGSTQGTRLGGTFVTGGWRVDNQYDAIYWHVGTFGKGAFEYDVKGLNDTCPGGAGFKNELSHMYDFTWNNADNQYAPGYRDDPYKEYIRKQCESGKERKLELVWAVPPDGNFLEIDTSPLTWSAGNNYHWRTEWENTGGVSILRIFRDGGLVFQGQVNNSWNPAGQSVRIASSSRRADEGANTGVIYSNVKVFDDFNSVPSAPSITAPNNGETVNTNIAYVQFSGGSHSIYQVRVNAQNNPDQGIVWDSQQVNSSRFFTWTGSLNNNTTYYVFARLGTAAGFSPWSSTGRTFTINTSFNPGGTDYVKVKGNTLVNNSGPFLGLGFTYMRSLRNCKFDRTRYTNDCAYMASKRYVYQRMLTMVDWDGLEIAPVSFTNSAGHGVTAWSDYWQQFRDDIDVAYSNGLKTEVTIFASAQFVMPSDSTRMAHIDSVLANLVGREHKVVLIEIANEGFQNGLSDNNDVRSKAQYIADRTPIPVALSSPADTSDGGIVAMNAGSAADISVVHFSRDIGTQEGGWLPVRDSYRTGVAGIAPLSSNEPIGAGSSVSTENDPIKLCMAAVFAFTANLPHYVYHSRAGTFGWELCCPAGGQEKFFSASPGNDSYFNIMPTLPKDLASWERNDGKASASPFSSYSNGQANKWWTEVGGATSGCVRNISAIKGGQFVTCPIGILGGGLELEARRPMNLTVYNPLTGGVAYNLSKNPGDRFTLATGPGAYVIIGNFTDVPSGGGGNGNEVTIDMGSPDIINGLTNQVGGDGDTVSTTIGGRTCRKNMDPSFNDWYFYFSISDGYAFQGNKPDQYITVDYYDTGSGSLDLNYDSTDGNFYKGGPTIPLTNTNTWKTATIHVTDAYFGNRQNNGADFRFWLGGLNVTRYLDIVKVSIDPPQAPQAPFGGTARAIPGVIQAEDFDTGGQGTAYNDTETANNGGAYRPTEGVDIETTGDTSGTYNVGWINNGEWMEYTVNVNQTGDYAVKLRVASCCAGGSFHMSLNGANIFPSKNMAGTGGWQTYTTVIVPGIFLASGTNKILRFEVDTGGFNFNYMDFTFGGADVISCDLNGPDVNDGMNLAAVGDGDTISATIGGHFCRKNLDQASDFYMYFAMADIYAFQGSKTIADITVEYYDSGTFALSMQYDGNSNAYQNIAVATLTNTNTWKTAVVHITDAYFGNRQNSGADFRIAGPVNTTYYIDTVMVFSSQGAPPPAAPSITAPGNGSTITTLTPTITWSGAAHDQYQVRVSSQNDSNTSTNGWDSGTVTNSGNSGVSGTLRNYSLYYIFARLHNASGGWGAWSSSGYYVVTNTNNVAGTVYLGNSLPTSNGWVLNGTQSWENDGVDIVSSFISDGGSTVWQIADNANNKRSKLKYQPGVFNVDFTTGTTVAGRIRTNGGSGIPLYNLGVSNGGVGGHYLRIETSQVSLVDFNGNVRGTFALDGTQYHKYQLSGKNTTAGNNATAAWKAYVDGTQRITFTGAGVADGGDGFLMGQETLSATGTWFFDWTAGRTDGEFSPAQWDPVY